MSSLKDVIALLTDPTPRVQDPEDDVNIETVAHVRNLADDNDRDVKLYSVSELRSKTAPLLEDVDPAYAGRKVSRKSLDKVFQKELDSFDGEASYSESSSIENENLSLDVDESDSQESDESVDCSIEHFKKSVLSNQADDIVQDNDEESSGYEISEDEAGTSDEMVTKFSNIDVSSEIEKGTAVKAQQELFNRLCECRIKLQKLLIIANKLPQFNTWKILKEKGGEEIAEYLSKGSNSVKLLLNKCLNLQEDLLQQNSETKKLENSAKPPTSLSDEEIPSNTDEDIDAPNEEIHPKKSFKRKMKCDEYGEILAKRHKSLIPYRNSIIQKWDEKTKLSSGRITQKSFSAFESSAVKQIEQILQDECRLIKRTQLKRSLYRVLGKPEMTDTILEDKSSDNKSVSKQNLLLRDYDPEIFDDDDFYRQLLKDVIESKSVGIDPAVLKKQMEIQNIRNKIKKKVDTKASKGRKIRYDVHPKLVNFMAPIQTSTISDAARDNLIKCIFGKSCIKSS